ncbi:MAG TPA: ribonuclease D [Gammaproteobacteria bacterium]|nr:ribonuclease D [Gammaproteobacteria bacterium]
MDDPLWIDTPPALESLCLRIHAAEWIALDTEFMRERTYYPQLCLIQLATPELIACVDPLALPSLEPLLSVLADTRITKVLHSARQDLEIFFNLTQQVPAPVFDTQLAASFAGFPDQVGYGALVEALTGVHLDKGHTRADWSHRPLPDGAVRYAADDVRYLRDVYLKLRDELARRDRLDWLERERATLESPATYRTEPQDAWRRLRGLQRLKPRQLASVKSLAAWREQRAIAENLPRQWVLKDDLLTDMARQQPTTCEALQQMRGMNESMVRKHGAELLALIQNQEITATPPAPPARLDPAAEALLDALAAVVRIRSAEAGISPAQIVTRGDLERLVRGERELEILAGWRLETAGRDLLRLLDGELSLSVRDGRLYLTEAASR